MPRSASGEDACLSPMPGVPPVRWRLQVAGTVQGVGFRPWCVRQATVLGLRGWVRNDGAGVVCELQGSTAALAEFRRRLECEPPVLARVGAIICSQRPPLAGEDGFAILASQSDLAPVAGLPPDAAPCEACLDELFDPTQRRYRYPFTNCTQCGPRYTVVRRLPYDRGGTSLAEFPLCPDCAREYADPGDRRFHAQPIACPRCGPRLAAREPDGRAIASDDPLQLAAARIAAGAIVAVKGVGGYQLLCDARNADVVARLRARKRRGDKPLAVLVTNLASARQWVRIEPGAAICLESAARPIVLLPCYPESSRGLPWIAPGLGEWGVALPASPLHWLLLHAALGCPAGTDWRRQPQLPLWVMTSANPGGEPLVVDEDEAVERLHGLCDLLLVHDRAIVGRADDSVLRPLGPRPDGAPGLAFLRRARGWVPEPIELPGVSADAPPVLATGAWLKNTICLTRGRQAFVSPHIGDLDNAASCRALNAMVERLCDFLAVMPVAIAHDLHPDFHSSRQALALAAHWRVPAFAVQHHHAHAAAVAAEHGLDEALALVLDGVGLGADGQAWGGELLHLRGGQCTRLSHLPTLPMPGGDRAAREPWRMAAALLAQLGRAGEIVARFPQQPLAAATAALLASPERLPQTTSAGRLFDAAAALLGVCECNRHEAEAAMRLEALAAPVFATTGVWPQAVCLNARGDPDLDGLYAALVAAMPADADARAHAAAAFHRSLAALLVAWMRYHQRAFGRLPVVLGGGVWANRLLYQAVVAGLETVGLRVYAPWSVPAGDGGIALGQAAVALARLTGAESLQSCGEDRPSEPGPARSVRRS